MIAALTQDNNHPAARAEAEKEPAKSAPYANLAEVLAGLGRVSLTGGGASEAILRLPRASTERFADLAVRTRLTTPCARAFARAQAAMPAALAEAVQAARARAAVSNGRVYGLARLAFPILARANIAAIAFKGPFQHRQIHGDPFFCRSGDLDLLVPRQCFIDALKAFEAEGFERRDDTSRWWTSALGEVHLVHPQGGVIDLHYRLQQPGCPPPRDLPQFLREAGREQVGATEIAVPTKAHAVLICALNLTKEFAHRRMSARYAYDFAAGVLGMDAEQRRDFAALAEHQRLTGTVGFAAALAGTIFDIALPLSAPLMRHDLPEWASREAVLAMAFDPEAAGTPWPRRRAILWAMCSGAGGPRKAAEFSREAARVVVSEALRRSSGTGK